MLELWAKSFVDKTRKNGVRFTEQRLVSKPDPVSSSSESVKSSPLARKFRLAHG